MGCWAAHAPSVRSPLSHPFPSLLLSFLSGISLQNLFLSIKGLRERRSPSPISPWLLLEGGLPAGLCCPLPSPSLLRWGFLCGLMLLWVEASEVGDHSEKWPGWTQGFAPLFPVGAEAHMAWSSGLFALSPSLISLLQLLPTGQGCAGGW